MFKFTLQSRIIQVEDIGYSFIQISPGLNRCNCLSIKSDSVKSVRPTFLGDVTNVEMHEHALIRRLWPTVLFCLGQLHEFLLFQSVHHVRQASFATLRRPEGEAEHWLPAIPGTLLWLGWRGRVSPVGVD